MISSSLHNHESPSGDEKDEPLEVYRQRASFDTTEMLNYIAGRSHPYVTAVLKTLEKDPLFQQNADDLSLDGKRRLAHLQIKRFLEYDFFSALDGHSQEITQYILLGFWLLGDDVQAKYSISTSLFASVVLATSLHPHIQEIALEAKDFKFTGSFALTEFTHGSNTQKMQTTATYDASTQEFVLHTPSFAAAKCWIGNLGCTASFSVVFAQLYTPDGECHGLHSFIVPIRDRKTHLPFKGITVGDMGRKLGMNGKDNGYMLFDNYRIPRDHLLNRTADVTPEGKYVTPFKSKSQRFGAQLGILSSGRVGISAISSMMLNRAITIAVRYSAARKQFGPPGKDEWPVLEYETQYWRLTRFVAAGYIWKTFTYSFSFDYKDFTDRMFQGETTPEMAELGKEIHAVSCASKPYGTWQTRDCIQECREACGGHGYLAVNQFGKFRNNHDSSCTYEGDNNVLLQQTGNYLVSQERQILSGNASSPLGSLDVFRGIHECLREKCTAESAHDFLKPETIFHAYKWLLCYLYTETLSKIKSLKKEGKSSFIVKNESQVYYSRSMSLAYVANFALMRAHQAFEKDSMSASLRAVLRRLLMLFGLWSIEPNLVFLSQGNYFQNGKQIRYLHDAILILAKQLKDDAIPLTDSFGLSDFAIKAPIGYGQGNALKHLFDSMVTNNKESQERVSWWKEIVTPPEIGSKTHLVAKL